MLNLKSIDYLGGVTVAGKSPRSVWAACATTRVGGRHFRKEDYKLPNNVGSCMLKDGAIPTVLCWSGKGKQRRKVIRHTER